MAMETGEQSCPRCGMPRSQWKGNNGQGYSTGGQTYCCRGCAEDAECTCQ